MTTPAPDRAALLALLPEARVGIVDRIDPITLGLSGAGVWAVSSSRGAYVLRVQGYEFGEGSFAHQLRLLRRAADAGIAPAVVHVDEAARAVVSVRIEGVPIHAALADPAQRAAALASVVDRLRTLHALDPADIAERHLFAHARATWEAARTHAGFPPWAGSLAPTFDAIAAVLAADPRRVVSHNDVNPRNLVWDGAHAWLVDWEVAGIGHPYYDLATFALFLRLDDGVALDLVARHDGAPLDERSRTSFRALRQLVGVFCGLTFLAKAGDLTVRLAPTRADAPSLGSIYAAMRTGEIDLQSPYGCASMGLALLAESV